MYPTYDDDDLTIKLLKISILASNPAEELKCCPFDR